MAYTSHISSRGVQGRGGNSTGSAKSPTLYGRVVDIIMSADDPRCTDISKIYGVFYRNLKTATNEEDVSTLEFAPQGNATNRLLPLIGEIVLLEPAPGSQSLQNPERTQLYWKGVVNIWNHPHHNAAPDTKQLEWQSKLLGGLPEQKTINPLQANPGDYLIESRLGSSIRLGGYLGKNTGLIDNSNNSKPIIQISNGQILTKNGSDLIYEDINKDYNSLYFLSDHKVPLKAANTKRDTYNELPIAADQYKGNQIILNAGRLYLNAKEESLFISAFKATGINSETVNIDGTGYICLDAPKIYLGSTARTATKSLEQPTVLGGKLENWLTTLLETLDTVADAMQIASALGAGPVTSLNVTGGSMKATIAVLKQQFKIFQSKKIYVE